MNKQITLIRPNYTLLYVSPQLGLGYLSSGTKKQHGGDGGQKHERSVYAEKNIDEVTLEYRTAGMICISIIVPVYNAEKYLVRCLDSLTEQTLNEIEILCVNDGSTDKSAEILNRYAEKDTRIRIFHQENKGPGVARNLALDNVKGKYILFCDADDTLEPDACRECFAVMISNDVDMVVFNTNLIEVDRTSTNNKNFKGEYTLLVEQNNKGILRKIDCIKISILSNIWGYLYRTDLINHYSLRFTHYRNGEDTIFLQSYLMIVKTGFALDKKLYNYFAYKGSLTDAVYSKYNPWFIRFNNLLILLYNAFKFSIKNKIPFKIIYVFYWLFHTLISRFKNHEK
jgi:glycosyltransferase involved in cell wall biosynthesis